MVIKIKRLSLDSTNALAVGREMRKIIRRGYPVIVSDMEMRPDFRDWLYKTTRSLSLECSISELGWAGSVEWDSHCWIAQVTPHEAERNGNFGVFTRSRFVENKIFTPIVKKEYKGAAKDISIVLANTEDIEGLHFELRELCNYGEPFIVTDPKVRLDFQKFLVDTLAYLKLDCSASSIGVYRDEKSRRWYDWVYQITPRKAQIAGDNGVMPEIIK